MYSYEEFIEDLNLGHEVEFDLNDFHFLISYNEDGWYCVKQNEEVQLRYDSVEQLISKSKIEGKTIKELWNHIIVTSVF